MHPYDTQTTALIYFDHNNTPTILPCIDDNNQRPLWPSRVWCLYPLGGTRQVSGLASHSPSPLTSPTKQLLHVISVGEALKPLNGWCGDTQQDALAVPGQRIPRQLMNWPSPQFCAPVPEIVLRSWTVHTKGTSAVRVDTRSVPHHDWYCYKQRTQAQNSYMY